MNRVAVDIVTDTIMPADKAVELCESLGLNPSRTISITLIAGEPVEARVLVDEEE